MKKIFWFVSSMMMFTAVMVDVAKAQVVPPTPEEVRALSKACEEEIAGQGEAKAWKPCLHSVFRFAFYLEDGQKGFRANYAEALRLYQFAAERGHIPAMQRTGHILIYQGATTAVENFEKAQIAFNESRAWIEKAAAAYGADSAHSSLEDLNMFGIKEMQRWLKISTDLLNREGAIAEQVRELSAKGKDADLNALRKLFKSYQSLRAGMRDGKISRQLGVNAITLLELAGEAGDKFSQFDLGEIYSDRMGSGGPIPGVVEMDAQKALFWYKKAADQGHATAARFYKDLYEKTHDLEKFEARKAAEKKAAAEDYERTAPQREAEEKQMHARLAALKQSGARTQEDVDFICARDLQTLQPYGLTCASASASRTANDPVNVRLSAIKSKGPQSQEDVDYICKNVQPYNQSSECKTAKTAWSNTKSHHAAEAMRQVDRDITAQSGQGFTYTKEVTDRYNAAVQRSNETHKRREFEAELKRRLRSV